MSEPLPLPAGFRERFERLLLNTGDQCCRLYALGAEMSTGEDDPFTIAFERGDLAIVITRKKELPDTTGGA